MENKIENQEIVEFSEKDLKKIVERIKKQEYSENIEESFSERKTALSILGFGKNRLTKESFPNQNVELPELTDEDYVRVTTKDLVEEMLEGNHIDLELLQDIVKIQNGIKDSNLVLSDTMKKIIVDDEALEKETTLARDLNMKKLKANIELGRINPEQEWIDLLKEKTDYENIKVGDEEFMKYSQQIPSEDQAEAEVSEKSDLEMNSKIPKIERELNEYWDNLYRMELEKMGLLEMRLHTDGDELKRNKFDNEFLDKSAKIYTRLKSFINKPYESTSIVQMDEQYNIPMQELFRESRFSSGIKFKTLPEADEQHTFKLAALKVRSSGIRNPYVYTSKPTSDHDLLAKNRFVENQIRALLEYADYDIEEISVPNGFKPVLEKIKNEEAKKNMHIMDMEDVLDKVINGKSTDMERRAFLDYIDVKENHNGQEVSMNFNLEDSNDKKLIDSISKGKKLIEENNLPMGRSGQITLLKEKFEFAKNYTNGQEPIAPEQVNSGEEKIINDNNQNLDNDNVKDIDLDASTLTANEAEIIKNKKLLERFDNYEGDKSNPESDINDQLEAIIGLKNKLQNPEIEKQLSSSQSELIERKAIIAETFRDNPQLDDNEKSIIKKVLHQGSVASNYRQLEAQEEGMLIQMIENNNLDNLNNSINKLRDMDKPNPNPNNNNNLSQQNSNNWSQEEIERMSNNDHESYSESFNHDPNFGLPDIEYEDENSRNMQDLIDQEQNPNIEMPKGIDNSNTTIEKPTDDAAEKILKSKQKQKVRVKPKN